jgi:thymidine kinase
MNASSGTGELQVILGPMYSGKSSELIRRLRRYGHARERCLLVKLARDHRYAEEDVVTHDRVALRARPADALLPLLDDVCANFDVVGVDEGQFFPDGEMGWGRGGRRGGRAGGGCPVPPPSVSSGPDAPPPTRSSHPDPLHPQPPPLLSHSPCPRAVVEFAEAAARAGKIVVIAALDGDFLRRPFGRILELVPLAEKVRPARERKKECGGFSSAAVPTHSRTRSRTHSILGCAGRQTLRRVLLVLRRGPVHVPHCGLDGHRAHRRGRVLRPAVQGVLFVGDSGAGGGSGLCAGGGGGGGGWAAPPAVPSAQGEGDDGGGGWGGRGACCGARWGQPGVVETRGGGRRGKVRRDEGALCPPPGLPAGLK